MFARLLSILTACLLLSAAQATNPITESSIRRLDRSLVETADIESTSERRRALKRIARDSLSLLEKHADAPNRFQVLGLAFRAQKELLILRNDARNRADLQETSRKLLEAPYEYATDRLPADTLLLQLDFDREKATEHEQAIRIAELADRYRNTAAELDSLMFASEMAFDLGHAELLRALRGTLLRKYREDLRAIEFLRERFAYNQTSMRFVGTFDREDKETLSFPIDRMGHVYLSCYWSKDTPHLKERVERIKDLQKKHPGAFDVFSFNLDQRPDAGKSLLQAMGLDWTPMHLPGGAENPRFRAYGPDPAFLIRIINVNGYLVLTPIGSVKRGGGRILDLDDYMNTNLEKPEYRSMIQSIRIGDFLVAGATNKPHIPPPPMRYRLSQSEALAAYEKIDRWCAEASRNHSNADDRNRRIIALMGRWNLSGEPEFLNEAVRESRVVLGRPVPPEARIVPWFCLSKQALRKPGSDAERVLSDFNNAVGTTNALAIAAAAVLSLDACSPYHLDTYRRLLLTHHADRPEVWPVSAYLYDMNFSFRAFRSNNRGAEVMLRHGMPRWFAASESVPRKLGMRFKTLDGNSFAFPHPNPEKINVAVFMDLPADDASAEVQREMVTNLTTHARSHIHGNLNVVLVYLNEDTEQIKSLVERHQWSLPVAVIPKGIQNANVLRLGIFLQDQRPNTFVVGRDGTVIWAITGTTQNAGSTTAVPGKIATETRKLDLAIAEQALREKQFEKALRIFEKSFSEGIRRPTHDVTRAQRMGRARAYAGLRQWDAAEQELDGILEEHTKASGQSACMCFSLAEKLLLRAEVLERLAREDEAAEDRRRAADLACPPEKPRPHPDHAALFAKPPRILFPTRDEPDFYTTLQAFSAREDWPSAHDYLNTVIAGGRDGKQTQRNVLADWLRLRADVLAHRGLAEQARKDRRWAEALTNGVKSKSEIAPKASKLQRFVDVVR